MILLETLGRKYSVEKPNGDIIIDLTRASLEYKRDVSYTGYTIVTNQFVMRPDLIAESSLGNPNKLDYILKFNGVSNPLSIYDGQVLLIPDVDQMSEVFIDPKPLVKQKDVDVVKIIVNPKTKVDKKRLEILQKKAENKIVLPPNINAPGEDNIVFTDDKIILGANISNVDPLCSETTTRARLKQKLLNKKIIR